METQEVEFGIRVLQKVAEKGKQSVNERICHQIDKALEARVL